MRAAERPASRLPTTRIGAATRGHSTARRPPLRSAPSAWGATVPHPSSSKDCMCRPTRSPRSASSPCSAARQFFNFYAVDLNVQTSDAVTTFIRLPPQTYATRDQRIAFHEQLKARLLSVPGVTASTVASAAPFSPAGRRQLTSIDGQPTTEPPPDVMTVLVEPAYFQSVVRGLVLGESFSELHGTPGHEAAIVNQRFADLYLGAGNPIGRHLELRPPTAQRTYLREADGPAPPVRVTIVGVSPDIRQSQQDPVPMVYLPFRADAPAAVTLIVRGTGGSARIVSAARDAANAVDPDLALGVVRTLDELRDLSRALSAGCASQSA